MKTILYTLLFLVVGCKMTPKIVVIDDRTSDIEIAKLASMLSGQWDLQSEDLYADSTQVVPFIFEPGKVANLCDSIAKLVPNHKPVTRLNLTYVGDNLLEADKEFICNGINTEQSLWVVKVTGTSKHHNWQTSQQFSIIEYNRSMIVTNIYKIEFFNIDAPAPSGEVVSAFNRQLWMDVSYTTQHKKAYQHQIKFKKHI